MEIAGTSALVTGGASGLGLATVAALAKSGAGVVAIDLPSANTDALTALGDTVQFVPADVTDEDAVTKAVELANTNNALRIVVNCAGIGNGIKTVSRKGPFPLDAFEKVIKINLIGTFNVLRLAAYTMSQNEPVDGERGVIVNTSSGAAFDGQIGQAAYAASKGAVAAATLPIARDLASLLIRVNTIAPGLFKTPLLASLPEAAMTALEALTLHPHRLGDPREFAHLVEAIVTNPMLNGETIRLDGAVRMPPQ
ncbi:SDR family NAD(P)-dependent oxidoreductase (plasmid) [Rhodococcus sp. USK10]|uniref:SDR family NAD(P)-dependent oxidoreductase n=1 Tax=Rhodococcus sp. USK10 TaxID=2789739 RepID=UPI001C5E7DF0|nr:SDR family NAD(P)-dependent oxidoreductase [Rhodococcus sp. USK10]QYA99625.1 SDR family NAD(P)-dependent oxidoreductase [Rhodococcus sp. USK10]